jgi:hypothetical protein
MVKSVAASISLDPDVGASLLSCFVARASSLFPGTFNRDFEIYISRPQSAGNRFKFQHRLTAFEHGQPPGAIRLPPEALDEWL